MKPDDSDFAAPAAPPPDGTGAGGPGPDGGPAPVPAPVPGGSPGSTPAGPASGPASGYGDGPASGDRDGAGDRKRDGAVDRDGDGSATDDDALPDLADGEWSLASRLVIAVSIALVSLGVVVHLAMVFLHVTPSNTMSRKNAGVVDSYINPEFEQNWKLFAPNPLQQNVAVHARAEVLRDGGERITTGWVDLSKQDGDAIKHNVAPSHADQNMLRRAWDFYTNSHDETEKGFGDRGALSQEYIRRIVAHRFGPTLNGGRVDKVQVRSATTPVTPPAWADEVVNTDTVYRVLPWWPVAEEDFR